MGTFFQGDGMADLHFFPWGRPLLPAVAEHLSRDHSGGGTIDLTGLVLVVPGSRAGRRLMELLVLVAEERALTLIPPKRVLTTGALPEELYHPPTPLAVGATARRCWARALEMVDPEIIRTLFGPAAMEEGEGVGLAQARILDALNRTVGAAGVTFEEVARECRRGFLFSDEERWHALARIQEEALGIMKRAGRMDREEARRLAIRDGALTSPGTIVLVGIPEMPRVTRQMLKRIEGEITALVHAPREVREGFDELGLIRPSWWQEWDVPLSDASLAPADRPGDQASEVIRFLAHQDPPPSPEEVTVGVPDPTLVPYLIQRFETQGQPARYAEGKPLSSSPPFRLLRALGAYLETGRFKDLASLLRHPDLPAPLLPGRGPELLDRYFEAHFPDKLGPDAGFSQQGRDDMDFAPVLDALHSPSLLGGLTGEDTLSGWMPRILQVLARLYEEQALDSARPEDRLVLEAASRIRDQAEELATLPPLLDQPCQAGEALRILLSEACDLRIPPEAREEAVELVGWLELHLDDAPVLALTGVNDPFLPEAINADPFLPNAIRSRLGLQDNRSRFARDAYWLTAIHHSRRELRVIPGLRSPSGDPLRPSRLLLTGPPEKAAARILLLTSGEGAREESSFLEVSAEEPAGEGGFRLPPQPNLPFPGPPQPLPVTAFASILANPYAWVLESVMKLRSSRDDAQELDPLAFGILAHAVLERFGDTGEAHSSDEDVIASRLSALLDDEARRRFGPTPLPTVPLQVEQLRFRLGDFARWQAEWVREGWRIQAVEVRTPAGGVPFPVDGVPFYLSGRIDRIDRHEETGAWALLDYKTGEGGGEARRARTRNGWVDLQLPLYRRLFRTGLHRRNGEALTPADPDQAISMGYLPLSKEAGAVNPSWATWSEEEIEEAEETARTVVRWLRSTEEVPFRDEDSLRRVGDELASLLGAGILQSPEEEP